MLVPIFAYLWQKELVIVELREALTSAPHSRLDFVSAGCGDIASGGVEVGDKSECVYDSLIINTNLQNSDELFLF